jgi:hypothetical protein
MKAGELEGVRQLTTDVADHVLPRFIVPPGGERDDTSPPLFDTEDIPDISVALAAHWRGRPALIDLTHVIREGGREKLSLWLPTLFKRAREKLVRAIPMVMLSDLDEEGCLAFKSVIAVDEDIQFAVCIPYDLVSDADFDRCMANALGGLGLSANFVAALVDFGGSDFSDPALVAPVIKDALERLQEFGQWKQIIFQGTNYPETNPAKDGECYICPRNEWHAWQEAVKFDSSTAEHITFGDYAADCAKMSFTESRAPAIRHIRYATENHWIVQRAGKFGSDTHRMHGVYKALAESPEFASAGFSEADAYIARGAVDPTAGMGNSATWRQLNTTHHITQAVAGVARVRGVIIKRSEDKERVRQLAFII